MNLLVSRGFGGGGELLDTRGLGGAGGPPPQAAAANGEVITAGMGGMFYGGQRAISILPGQTQTGT